MLRVVEDAADDAGDGTTRTLHLDLAMPAALMVFAGHFPEAAIVPGVAQLDWALKFAAQHALFVPSDEEAPAFEQLKWQRVIRPETPVTLTLAASTRDGTQRLAFRYHDARGPFSQGIALAPVPRAA